MYDHVDKNLTTIFPAPYLTSSGFPVSLATPLSSGWDCKFNLTLTLPETSPAGGWNVKSAHWKWFDKSKTPGML
jgi:hypothetical protein